MSKGEWTVQIIKIILGVIALVLLWNLFGRVCIINQNMVQLVYEKNSH